MGNCKQYIYIKTSFKPRQKASGTTFVRTPWSAAEVAKLVAGLRAAHIRDLRQLKSELAVLTAWQWW
jgi:hypothetical protein